MIENNKDVHIHYDPLPIYLESSFRYFEKDEKHVDRVCDFYVLIFMLGNTLYFSEGEEAVEVCNGEWYLQEAGKLQQGIKGCPSPEYFYIHFKAEKSVEGKKGLSIPIRGTFNLEQCRSFFDQLEDLHKKIVWDILGKQAVFLNLLNHLLTHPSEQKREKYPFVNEIINDMHANFQQTITLDELSRKHNFSKDYIIRKMKDLTGYTPIHYLQQIRMNKAKALLTNTNYTIEVIMELVGYKDISVFYKIFKKMNGISPGDWRQKYRGFQIESTRK